MQFVYYVSARKNTGPATTEELGLLQAKVNYHLSMLYKEQSNLRATLNTLLEITRQHDSELDELRSLIEQNKRA